jgi:phage shock protein PspC (stress-responsive transcriptional regulator)
MFCTKCGVPLRDDDRFCSQCGNATALGRTVPSSVKVLRLDKANKKIAGVRSGFSRYFEMDVSLMRVLWLAMIIITGGLGLFVYIAAWLIVPADPVPPVVVYAPQPERT